MEKQLSRGDTDARDELDSDGETGQEENGQTEFVCPQSHRILKSATWIATRKCETTSIINSEDSNVEEQSVTAACPTCSKENRYVWLLRHMLAKRPGHDESLRPQSHVKPEGEKTRTNNGT
ncbi:hypothetical protein ERJ75_000435000 [Trypanosoma vivax]|nr:hypothetical protein ERJ75_001128500 [Trypanosoma vivax]KAH8616878.1 hypothetical protein ERJ75_000435000 [Trypanosoma vivax]